MNLSSASSAFNEAAHDGNILNVDAVVHSPPRLRQSQRQKRQNTHLDRDDDDEDDGKPYAKFYRSYQADTVSHRRVHSPQCIRRVLEAVDEMDMESSDLSQQLLTQPPDFVLAPNVFIDRQGIDDYHMDDDEREVAEFALQVNNKIPNPHPFQIAGVHHGAFRDDAVIDLIAKTGYGKSVVPAAIGSLRRGVVLTLVPLLGLGSDLVNKSVNIERGMEAYHVDEHKGDDAIMLAERLSSFSADEAEHITIQLFISPRALTPTSPISMGTRVSSSCLSRSHLGLLYR
jgi:hypothetical protein